MAKRNFGRKEKKRKEKRPHSSPFTVPPSLELWSSVRTDTSPLMLSQLTMILPFDPIDLPLSSTEVGSLRREAVEDRGSGREKGRMEERGRREKEKGRQTQTARTSTEWPKWFVPFYGTGTQLERGQADSLYLRVSR